MRDGRDSRRILGPSTFVDQTVAGRGVRRRYFSIQRMYVEVPTELST